MIEGSLSRSYRGKINSAPSPIVAIAFPWLTIMLGSLSPTWPLIASAPIMPPFGLIILIAWRQLRPGLLPVWAGFPLGLFDDLFSGQPLGSAILLWSIVLIVLEIIELRIPWRNFLVDWAVGSGLIAVYLIATLGLSGTPAPPHVIGPQLATSVAAFPLIGRLVALGDRLRLMQFRTRG